jgi:hypothetical protein
MSILIITLEISIKRTTTAITNFKNPFESIKNVKSNSVQKKRRRGTFRDSILACRL